MSVSNPIRITLDISDFDDIKFQVLSAEVDMRISAPFKVKVTVAQKVTDTTMVFFDDMYEIISKNLKATLTINYQNNDTEFVISGAISELETTNAAGGILDLAVIEITPEWDQYYFDKFTGVYYYGQAIDIMKTLYDDINTTEYSKYTQAKHNFVTSDETLYPTHPIYARYQESTLAFYERILAEHGLWYLWVPVKGSDPETGEPSETKDHLELAVFDNWESFDNYVAKMDELDQDLYDQSLTLAQSTAGLESVFEHSISTPAYSGHPTDVEAEHSSLYSFSRKHQAYLQQQKEAQKNNQPKPEAPDDLWASAVSSENAIVPKEVEFVHYNPEAPEILLRSKYNSSYQKSFGLQQFKTTFNTMNQDQLDAHLNVKVKNIEYKQATSVIGHYGGKILLPGTKLTLRTEKRFGFKADHYRVSQVYLQYRSELLTPAMTSLEGIAQAINPSQIDQFHLAKNYVEDHTFIAKDSVAEYGSDLPKLENINQINGVYPYRDTSNKYDTIEPNLAGSVKVKFPYDYETTFDDNPDNRYYCPKLSDYNSQNANHSAPYYPMTELLVAYIDGNINKPIIKAALSHRDTANLSTDKNFDRNYKHFDQGNSFAFTSDVGNDIGNSMMFKSEHSDFNEVSHMSVNNVPSTTDENENHLDQIFATSANKTKEVKGELEESHGIDPTGKTNIPNQYKLVKPARPINEDIDPIQGAVQAVSEATRTPELNTVLTKYIPMVQYNDFLGRDAEELECVLPNGTTETFSQDNDNLYCADFTDEEANGQEVSVQVRHTDKANILSQKAKAVSGLKANLQIILAQTKSVAKAHQEAFDDTPWYEKAIVSESISVVAASKGMGHFFVAIWEQAKKIPQDLAQGALLSLVPIQTYTDITIKDDLKKASNVLAWLAHGDNWDVLTTFAEDYMDIFKDYPIYAQEQAFEFVGGLIPAFLLAVLTRQPGLFAAADEGAVTKVVNEMMNIAKADEKLSQEIPEAKVMFEPRVKQSVRTKRPGIMAIFMRYKNLPEISKEMSASKVVESMKDAEHNIKYFVEEPYLTDAALKEKVGTMPEEGDWMVRFIANFKANPEVDSLGRVTKGEQKLWFTKLDHIKENDFDADRYRRSLGMSKGGEYDFDPNKTHSLVLYRYYKPKEGATFVPTYENMQDFAGKYDVKKFTPEQAKQVLTPDFATKYENALNSDFARSNHIDAWSDEAYIQKLVNNSFPNDPETQDLFKARAAIDRELGVFKEWTGKGLTKYMPHDEISTSEPLINKQYGTLEWYFLEKNPPTINQLGEGNYIMKYLDKNGVVK